MQGSILTASQQQANQHSGAPHQLPRSNSSTSSFMDFSPPSVGFKSQSSGSGIGGGVDLDTNYQSGPQSLSQQMDQNLSGGQGRGSENNFNPSPALQNFNSFSSSTGSALSYQVQKTQNTAVSCATNYAMV